MAPLTCACWIFVAVFELHLLACVSCHVRVSTLWVVAEQVGCGDSCPPRSSHPLLSLPELEELHLGLYGMSDRLTLAKEGSPLLTQKWGHTLRELDLCGQGFSEKDLEQALAAFSGTSVGSHLALCSLNLRGTRVTPSTVRSATAPPQFLEVRITCPPILPGLPTPGV